MKILFISVNRVGDAVLTTGILSWLVDRYPEASFTVVCGPYAADLFRAVPRLERLIVMKKKRWNAHWLDLWRACRSTKWDFIVDMRNSIVSRLLCAKEKAIHSRGKGRHKVIENAAVLGLEQPPDPNIWLTAEAEREADTLLPSGVPILALGPAANWPYKQWPVDYFAELTKKLTGNDGPLAKASVLVLADAHERPQIEPLLKSIPDDRRIEVIGRGLQTAAACLKRARLYVGNDSGLMHLSAALGTPTLGLFGPGFPDIYGPWGKKCAFVTTPETRDELMALLVKENPPPTLLGSLTVEKVAKAAEDLLTRGSD
ncbi:MAG: glycosyltransferase family 9 protein [Alphaproteobacteria bacterium]|nr:glycosyltransferase family 9 protein [Alphaproteobacteria bacterium]